jgi:transcriptional regulator with XRE-family HTH domain
MKTDITGGFDVLRYLEKLNHLDTPKAKARYERYEADSEISMMLYALRKAAGLTQAALAKRVGTTTSVISRIEDIEYRGHSMAILRRIARALGVQVVVRFMPLEKRPRPGWILDRAQKEAVRDHLVAEKPAPPRTKHRGARAQRRG